MKVFVYFNLHKKLFSVKALEGEKKGKVICHLDTINLKDVEFRVSKAGRERVLREHRKNVHAGVVGTVISYAQSPAMRDIDVIKYNPYKADTFVNCIDQPVHNAKYARLNVRWQDRRPTILIGE